MTKLDLGPDTRRPLYDSYCISNLANSVLSLFNVKYYGSKLPEDVFDGVDCEVQNIVLFVFDGLGYAEWKKQKVGLFGAMQSGGRVKPITTVFPSTTSTALTTIATGLTPQQHSLIEWYLYLQELDMIIQTLPFSPMGSKGSDVLLPKADPSLLFEGEPLFSRLKKEEISTDSIISKHIAFSSYSKLVHGQSTVHTYESISDLPIVLRKTLESRAGQSFTYVYWSGIDTIEHTYGPNTEEASSEANLVSHALWQYFLRKLDKKTAAKTLLVVTADHGHVANSINEMHWLNTIPHLEDYLAISAYGRKVLPWGAPRDVYIKVHDDMLDEAHKYISEKLKTVGLVVKTRDAVDAGLFGHGDFGKRFFSRVGNLMILPLSKSLVWYKFGGISYPAMLGHHGGLHQDEMTVPFATANAGSLLG